MGKEFGGTRKNATFTSYFWPGSDDPCPFGIGMRWLAIKVCQVNTGSGPGIGLPSQSRMFVMVATGVPDFTGLITAYVVSTRPPLHTDIGVVFVVVVLAGDESSARSDVDHIDPFVDFTPIFNDV